MQFSNAFDCKTVEILGIMIEFTVEFAIIIDCNELLNNAFEQSAWRGQNKVVLFFIPIERASEREEGRRKKWLWVLKWVFSIDAQHSEILCHNYLVARRAYGQFISTLFNNCDEMLAFSAKKNGKLIDFLINCTLIFAIKKWNDFTLCSWDGRILYEWWKYHNIQLKWRIERAQLNSMQCSN